MYRLQFAKDNGSQFYRELKDKIDAYFEISGECKSGNVRMKWKIILYFALVVITYAFMITSNTHAGFFIAYLAMGLAVLLVAFNVSHDAAHGVAVKSKKLNKLLFQLSFQLQGNNAYIWGKHHNDSHHLYTNIEGSDIDVLNNPLVRMTESQSLKWYHKYQFIYTPFLYLLYSLNWFLVRELLMAFGYSSRTIQIKMPKREVIRLVLFKLLYISYMIILPIFLLPISGWWVILAFILNHFMISIIFTGVLGVSHLSDYVSHPVPEDDHRLSMSWPTLQMATSIDYNPGSQFLNWTLGGFNAHALHHLLPDICHVHYLKILPIFRSTCKKYGIIYMEMPYGKALRSHFRFLKKMGTSEPNLPLAYEG